MKTRIPALFATIILVGAFLPSCVDLDTDPEYYADAFIVSRVIGGDTLYTLDATVEANVYLDTVIIENTDGSFIEGLSNIYYHLYFELEHDTTEYTAELPEAGTYFFNITTQDSEKKSITDEVTDETIDPVNIDSITYSNSYSYTKIKWDAVSDADYYFVRIYKSNTLVLQYKWISPSYNAVSFYSDSDYWSDYYSPSTGDALEAVIVAIRLGSSSSSSNYNIQALSYSAKVSFVWGEN